MSKELDLKVAERSARLEERKHYSKVVDRYKSNAEVLSTKVVSLTCNMDDNILQENLFIVLTSVEMVALC